MNKKIIFLAVVFVIIIIGLFLFFQKNFETSPNLPAQNPVVSNSNNPNQNSSPVPSSSGALPNGDTHAKGKIVQISIKDFSFNPASIEVDRDTAIEWTNNDTVTHTIVSDSNIFGSATLNPGQSYTFVVSTRGTFNYHCSIHPSIMGVVVVK